MNTGPVFITSKWFFAKCLEKKFLNKILKRLNNQQRKKKKENGARWQGTKYNKEQHTWNIKNLIT